MQNVTLAERIQQFRMDRGLTQQELADLLNVSRVTILRWETGTSKPTILAASKLESIGFGTLTEQETKYRSVPRLTLQSHQREELRNDIRSSMTISGSQYPFEPSPYVINGPADQLEFFETLYKLQDVDALPCTRDEYFQRLALVSSISGIQPSQHILEKPKQNSKSWNPNYGSHGWHRYIGRFPSHLVRSLINHFGAKKGDVILDPFAGSGTTLVEARLLGMNAIGIEICPLSALISRTKSKFPTQIKELQELKECLNRFYESRWNEFVGTRELHQISHEEILVRRGNPIQNFANIDKWFIPEALLGVSIVTEFALTLDKYARDFVCCALSSCMRSIGNVDVDVVRAEYRKKPRKNVDVLKLVNRAITRMLADIEAMVSTHHLMLADSDCIDVIENSVLETKLPQGSIDYIITSPPYGVEASSYLRTHLLSYRSLQPILNYDPYTMNNRIIGSEYVSNNGVPNPSSIAASMSETFVKFFDGQLARETSSKVVSRKVMMMHFFDDMVALATQFHTWLRPGGRIAFVVGNKKVGNHIVPTDAIVSEIFHASGLELDDVIQHKLKFNNSNSEVPWQERTIQDEFVMLFTNR